MPSFISIIGLTTLLLSTAALANETYLLQAKAEVGQVWEIDTEVHRHRLRITTISGVDRPQVEEKSDLYFKAMVTAVEVKGGSIVAAKIDVDSGNRVVTTLPGGQQQTQNSHVAEITATVTEARHLQGNIQVDLKDVSNARFDIDAGRTLSVKSKIDGKISTPATEAIQVNGTIDESSEIKTELLSAAPAASTTAPAASTTLPAASTIAPRVPTAAPAAAP